MRDRARTSAELARHAATEIDRPALARAADTACIHSTHVGAVSTMLIALGGAAVLIANGCILQAVSVGS